MKKEQKKILLGIFIAAVLLFAGCVALFFKEVMDTMIGIGRFMSRF